MRPLQRVLRLMAALPVMLAVAACATGTPPHYIPVPDADGEPYIQAVVYSFSSDSGPSTKGVTGSAPCTIGAVVGGTNHPDYFGGPMYLQIQIDWGDGSGWFDVTADEPSWDYYYDDGMDPAGCTQHTYVEPGVYRIRSRATYWDGLVVESRSSGIYTEEPTVTVTEPESEAP